MTWSRILFHVVWAIVGLPINFLNFLDEVFHLGGAYIEGAGDNTGWFARFGMLLGLFAPETEVIACSEEYYRLHPWKRDFSLIAAPIGWVLMLLIFGTVSYLTANGILELPAIAAWFCYYMSVSAGVCII